MASSIERLKAVSLENYKIAYFPVPKVASSTIKMMMYAIDFGEPFRRVNDDGTKQFIHSDYQSTRRFLNLNKADYSDFQRVAVLRDPVDRIISAFIHRVKMLNCLSEDVIDMDVAKSLNVPPNPPLHIFVKKLEQYRILSPEIKHHTDRFTCFLGSDLSYYTHIFKFNELPALTEFLSEKTGVQAVLPASPHTTNKDMINFSGLGFQGRASLLEYCAGDYAFMKKYYSDEKYLTKTYAIQK